MSISEKYIKFAKNYLPSPFTIAVLLTFLTIVLALFFTYPKEGSETLYLFKIFEYWELGFWGLLKFAMQMMLMLVLGYVLATTKQVDSLIKKIVLKCDSTPRAAMIVTATTIIVSLFNWGLGLIFGAILARKIGEHAHKNNYSLNYPIVGACGYVGLLVWHGGISGSAPIKVAETGNFLFSKIGLMPLSETVFSQMNIIISAAVLIILPYAMKKLAIKQSPTKLDSYFNEKSEAQVLSSNSEIKGAEKLDYSSGIACGFGALILSVALFKMIESKDFKNFSFLTPDYLNFVLLGLGILLYGNLKEYLVAVEKAIKCSAGIMIQFPIYAGIAGIMQHSGLVYLISGIISDFANETTFPVYAVLSAGVVNFFIPSGGGQWAVQGPILINAADAIGYPYSKTIMALAYGDQLTNMIQPFWALPLLGITRLKAIEILPYTTYMMLVAGAIYILGLVFL